MLHFKLSESRPEISVTETSISWTDYSGGMITVPIQFVFAVTFGSASSPSSSRLSSLDLNAFNKKSEQFILHYLVLNTSTLKKPSYKNFIFSVENSNIALDVITRLRDAIYPKLIKKVLVLINPFGGKKQAASIYNAIPARMFSLANIETEVVESQSVGHITKLINEIDVYKYDVITTVSGDGLFHELVNGILSRNDWETAAKIPLAMIAGGTASALNKNLDTLYPAFAALSIIKGFHS